MVLYYNFMAFMVIFFLLLLAIHCVVFWPYLMAVSDPTLRKRIETDAMCTPDLQKELEQKLIQESAVYCVEYATFAVITLVACVCFGVLQKKTLQKCLAREKSMRMHALCVVGLPAHATDEHTVKRLLEEEFSNIVGRPDGQRLELAH
eukprot:5778722-Amphidinium_carterae.1